MKVIGWVLGLLGALNLMVSIATFSTGVEAIGVERMYQRIGTAIGLVILGSYLVNRAAKKAADAAKAEKWRNS